MQIKENIDMQDSKLLGIANILASSPKVLIYWVLIATTLSLTVAIWWLWAYLTLIATIGVWIVVAFSILAMVKKVYHDYHRVLQTAYTTRMMREASNQAVAKTELAFTKVAAHKQLPLIIEAGIVSGKNVKFGGAEISDWKSSMHMLGPSGETKLLEMPSIILPAKTEMIEVARRQDFHRDNIFLALADSGDVTTTIKDYLHCANDGNTGSGKTSNWRGQLVQFLLSGIDCLLLNPNFALVTKEGDDWKPIAKALQTHGAFEFDLPRVVTKLANIGSVLDYMANTEVDRRFAMMREGDFSYKPLYLYIDEWPEIALKCKGANDNLGTLLRRGRAVELCVSVNSQGFLKEDTDLKGSARENFATTFFLGGSTYSGAKLLDISQKELEDMLKGSPEPIGKGVAVLRNNASMPNPEIVRLPYADNDFLYHCLGRDDSFRLPPENVMESESSNPESQDLELVYQVYVELQDSGIAKPDYRMVAEHAGMGKDKAGKYIKELRSVGRIV